MQAINADLPQLLALLQLSESPKDIREWYETSTYLYDIMMNSKIHDLVEGILGANFYCWANSFFIHKKLLGFGTFGGEGLISIHADYIVYAHFSKT